MHVSRCYLRLGIYLIIVFTFFLGLPQFHYSAALMIAIMMRHKDNPVDLFKPIDLAEYQD